MPIVTFYRCGNCNKDFLKESDLHTVKINIFTSDLKTEVPKNAETGIWKAGYDKYCNKCIRFAQGGTYARTP